ncbi:MAG: ATPase, partial [Nocardioidaceae bacterium]|nr:ATPase [Nocardioidaceae bacterium]
MAKAKKPQTSPTAKGARLTSRSGGGLPKGALDVDALLANPDTHIIVCCGSGGVGKTTTSAALGLRAAEQGRKVCVLPIDPARRLAQSRGLTELDNLPLPVKGAGA